MWIFLELCEVDFAAFWGLLAFPLNYIPTVGAMVASLPPVLVAMVDPVLDRAGQPRRAALCAVLLRDPASGIELVVSSCNG